MVTLCRSCLLPFESVLSFAPHAVPVSHVLSDCCWWQSISNLGAGYDTVDVAACLSRNIQVSRASFVRGRQWLVGTL